MERSHSPVVERHVNTEMMWHIETPDSGGVLSLGEVRLQPGDEPPLHIHVREDEAWYVLEGTILFQRGMERFVRQAGEAVFLPRGIPHGFAVQSPRARILHLYTPGGLEAAFHLSSVAPGAPLSPPAADPQAMAAAFEQRGVTFVGPPLPVLLASERGAA